MKFLILVPEPLVPEHVNRPEYVNKAAIITYDIPWRRNITEYVSTSALNAQTIMLYNLPVGK